MRKCKVKKKSKNQTITFHWRKFRINVYDDDDKIKANPLKTKS